MLSRCLALFALVALVAAQPTPPRVGVRFYLHVGFGGHSHEYDVGDHVDTNSFSTGFRRQTSSVVLAPGYGVTMFTNTDFTGQQTTLTSTESNFYTIPRGGGHWNDRAWSWRVFLLDPTTTPVPTTTTPPVATPFNCSLLPGFARPADPLVAAGEPVFSTDESGFVFLNTLEIVWYNPVHFDLEDGTIYAIPDSGHQCSPNPIGGTVTLPSGQVHPSECYLRCTVREPWTNFLAGPEQFIDTTNPAQSLVRGKLSVNNTQELKPTFRDEVTYRTILSDFPFEITFPTAVSANLVDLEAFLPPALAAALILQSVDVDIATLNADGRAIIRTQLQWPFKYLTGPGDFAVNTVNTFGKQIGVSVSLISDCADPGIADDSAGDNGNVAPCDQIWAVQLTPGPQVCDLDGVYNIDFAASCQPAFIAGGNCPLMGPSGSLEDNLGNVLFTLDSENFCPQVIEEVQITAALSAYKDAAFNTPAENFVIGDTIFFEAIATSTLVSLQSVTVSTIRIDYQNGNSVLEYDLDGANDCSNVPAGSPIGSACNLEGFSIDNTGSDRAAFSFQLTTPTFSPPTDGDQDFDVTVELDVTFIGVNLLGEEELQSVRLLQTASSATSRAVAASNTILGEDGGASGASMLSAAVALVGGVAALA